MRYSFSFITVFLSFFVFLAVARDADWLDARAMIDDLTAREFEDIEDLFQRHIESVPTHILARELRSRLDASMEARGIVVSKVKEAKAKAQLKYPCPYCKTKFASTEAAKGCSCRFGGGQNSDVVFKKY